MEVYRSKYPPISPNQWGHLDVGDGHCIYWEECGNPEGIPILFLHGGPGSGINEGHRCFFHPEMYRIILVDQRGSGKSTPHAELKNNTTWDLVGDLEKLRTSLNVHKWIVFGGSWGSTLALAYTQSHPSSVQAMIVRGIFLGSQEEISWLYQRGAHVFFTEEWEKYAGLIPEKERGDFLAAYYKRLTSEDPAMRKQAAARWTAWESVNLKLLFDPVLFAEFMKDFHADALARIECHYFVHRCFFPTDQYLLENMHKIAHIPAVIIQGRYDLICPFISAWRLHKAWPSSELKIIADAGHASGEKGIVDALIRATDSFGEMYRK